MDVRRKLTTLKRISTAIKYTPPPEASRVTAAAGPLSRSSHGLALTPPMGWKQLE